MANDSNLPLSAKQLQAVMNVTYDGLRILEVRNRIGNICARAGWTIEMVFHEGDTLPVRERAWKVTDLFIETVGAEKLVYWHGEMPAMLTSAVAQKRLSLKRERSQEDPKRYAMAFHLASGHPKPAGVSSNAWADKWADNAQDFRMRCWINHTTGIRSAERWEPGVGPVMSVIRMHLHAPWVQAQPPERGAGWFTSRVVALMRPFWCSAGWGVMPTVEERNIEPIHMGQQMLYPYLQRLPGLNAIDEMHALHGPTFNNAMHSVNWLNYVSDPLLDRLGGREAVRQQVKASKHLDATDVGNCLCIRAGQIPVLADTQHHTVLHGYGEAARLLKPIRAKSYRNNFVAPPPAGSMNSAEWQLACDAYLSRFDLM